MTQLVDRYNSGKAKWSLVDFNSFLPMVEVLEFGAQKYSAHNWKKGLKVTETLESLLRHAFALLRKEDLDPESKKHHIGHLQCNCMFLGYMLQHYPELDDRFEDPNYVKKDNSTGTVITTLSEGKTVNDIHCTNSYPNYHG